MSCLSILRKLGILPRVTLAEIVDADTENIERTVIEHGRAVARATELTRKIGLSNGRLRESIGRMKSSSFADAHHDHIPEMVRTMGSRR